MTFLAPWLLAALPAIGVPVIIHLLNRGKPRPMRWAAMQFLLDSARKNQRRLQLRDIILLILRALVVAFLVLLFARPAIWALVGAAGVLPAPVSGMIVLDVSASMAQSDGRSSRLDRAREEALDTLHKFSSDSLCGLILATDRAVPIVPRPSGDLELVRDQLNTVRGTFSATDLFPAIERAFQELARSPGADKIVFVFTDSQESAWRERPAIQALAAKYPGIALRSVQIGKAGEPNTAITGLSIQPASPTLGESSAVNVTVRNLTEKPLDGVRVTLAVNRDKPQDEATLPPIASGESASASLHVTFDQAGFQTLRAEIPTDLFPADNVRSLALRVGDPRRFLIVAAPTSADPRATPAFFLRTALLAAVKGAKVEVLPPARFTAEEVGTASAVFVASPAALSDAQWAVLEKYVRGGGGLVVFPEENSAPNLGASPATQWLPATLGKRLPQPAAWAQNSLRHPVTAPWADPARTRLSNINAAIRFELTPRTDAVALAEYTDRVPVAVSSEVGAGRAVVFGSAAVPASTRLVLHPFFPILLGALADYLDPIQASSLVLRPGDSFSIAVSPTLIGKKVFLAGDRSPDRAEAGVVAPAETEGRIRLASVEDPGGYRVFLEGNENAVAAFSVALDASESVLATSAPVEIEAVSKSPETESSPAATRKVPREVWLLFAVLLLILSLSELALAHRFTVTR